jgi:site-specific DNA-methyltransferase (adenine-specific)
MALMARYPDKYFELAIVDPPYGGGSDGTITRTGGTWNEKYYARGTRKTKTTEWDSAPSPEYFHELFRVSRNQIIWGGNYFVLPPSKNFIIWRKLTISENFTMAMAEYAWTNIDDNAKVFECAPQGTAVNSRIHPTQKPVALYKWLLSRYAHAGDKILDTHLGSGSIAIACHDLGYDLVACELDTDYYTAALDRLQTYQAQAQLFAPSEIRQSEQQKDLF